MSFAMHLNNNHSYLNSKSTGEKNSQNIAQYLFYLKELKSEVNSTALLKFLHVLSKQFIQRYIQKL